MLHINRVTLLGYVGRDPDIRTLQNGERMAAFSLATTRRWKGQDGAPAEATEWHRIAVFGGAVKGVRTMVRKGAAVLVEGRLAVREYRDREGARRHAVEIVVAGAQGMVNVLSPRPDEADAPAGDAPAGDARAGDGDGGDEGGGDD